MYSLLVQFYLYNFTTYTYLLISLTLPLSTFKVRSSLGFSFSGLGSPCLTCRLSCSCANMSLSDAERARSLTQTWMTLVESLPFSDCRR